MLRRLRLFLLWPVLLACSKSDSNPIVDFGEGEGITYRSGNNLPVGPHDPTDWTTDAAWNKQERALFANTSFDLNGTQPPALVAFTSVYPNPSAGQANWTLRAQQTLGTGPPHYTVQAALVNRNYQLMQRLGPASLVGEVTYHLDYLKAGLSPNELYRLYYVVYDASGLIYKGHGDVRYSQ